MSEFDSSERPSWAIRRGPSSQKPTTPDAHAGEIDTQSANASANPNNSPNSQDDAPSARPYGERPAREPRKYHGDRPPREDRGERSYGDRPPREAREPRGDRPPREDGGFKRGDRDQKPDIITELIALDKDILRLVTKRTRILSRIGSTQVSSKERKLRTAWEEQAAKTSRDPRLIRQLFALLQELDVNPQDDLRPSGFVLAPKRLPINITMPAPSCSRTTQTYLALMGASGSQTLITGVNLNDSVIECLKAFNQLGASMRWEDDGTIKGQETTHAVSGREAQKIVPMLDKVIHLGDDIFTLYLVIFHALTRPARIKLIGESSLALANLTPLRTLLTSLGARLTSLVPGQDGLPARLEASAILPENILIPEDLPELAFKALCTALPFWDKAIKVDMTTYPQGATFLTQIEPFLQAWKVRIEHNVEAQSFTITPSELCAPESVTPPMDMRLVAYLLALPAFTDGRITLQGLQSADIALTEASKQLLTQIGLHITMQDGQITSAWNTKRDKSEHPIITPPKDISNLHPDLVPLGLLLALAPNIQERRGTLPILPSDTSVLDPVILDSFITILGFEQADDKLIPYQGTTVAWASPDVTWTLALALAALLRSSMRLSNPATASQQMPTFWQFYNALPKHVSDKTTEEEQEAEETPNPSRRRVLIGHTPEAEMPDEVCTYQND